MNSLILPSTNFTPAVTFHPNGHLSISGKARKIKVCNFFKPLFDWLEEYRYAPYQNTILNLEFEILHVDSLVKIIDICRMLATMSKTDHNVSINWYYEEEDEDMQEMAEMISELFKTVPVNKIMITKDLA